MLWTRKHKKKYGAKRKTTILRNLEYFEICLEEKKFSSNVNLFLTKEGYLKKIMLQSLR